MEELLAQLKRIADALEASNIIKLKMSAQFNSQRSNIRAARLLTLLQTKGRMTAHDLADHLEVSERTIYRDLEDLGVAGVPVYTERGPGGGCSL